MVAVETYLVTHINMERNILYNSTLYSCIISIVNKRKTLLIFVTAQPKLNDVDIQTSITLLWHTCVGGNNHCGGGPS